MTIAAGHTVAASLNGTEYSPSVEGPVFGIAVSGSGPFVVQWRNGQADASVAAAALDDILAPDSDVQAALVGRRVQVTSPAGQTNWGLCVCLAVYKRDVGGAGGAAIKQYALLQNITTYAFQEALAANCAVVS